MEKPNIWLVVAGLVILLADYCTASWMYDMYQTITLAQAILVGLFFGGVGVVLILVLTLLGVWLLYHGLKGTPW